MVRGVNGVLYILSLARISWSERPRLPFLGFILFTPASASALALMTSRRESRLAPSAHVAHKPYGWD